MYEGEERRQRANERDEEGRAGHAMQPGGGAWLMRLLVASWKCTPGNTWWTARQGTGHSHPDTETECRENCIHYQVNTDCQTTKTTPQKRH